MSSKTNVSIFPIKIFLILNLSFLLISPANFYLRLPRRQNRPSATIAAQRCKRKFSGFGKRCRNYVMMFEHILSGLVRGGRDWECGRCRGYTYLVFVFVTMDG